MDDSKREFKVTKDGQELTLYIRNPTLQENEEAESIRLKSWTRAVKDGGILAEKLGDVLREQGIWDDDKEARQKEFQEELIESIRKIKRGGIKLQEARQLAIRIRQVRNELNVLTLDRVNYIDNCCEGQAQNRQFAFLVSCCTVYNDNKKKKYFSSFEDYLNRAKDIDAFIASNTCASVFYGTTDVSGWPENEFLKRYKFCNEKLQLIDSEGHLVDIDGKLIDGDGNLVKVVDGVDIPIDKDGNDIIVENEVLPFLSEDGQPILEEKTKDEEING